jgi:hypothetical protein
MINIKILKIIIIMLTNYYAVNFLFRGIILHTVLLIVLYCFKYKWGSLVDRSFHFLVHNEFQYYNQNQKYFIKLIIYYSFYEKTPSLSKINCALLHSEFKIRL